MQENFEKIFEKEESGFEKIFEKEEVVFFLLKRKKVVLRFCLEKQGLWYVAIGGGSSMRNVTEVKTRGYFIIRFRVGLYPVFCLSL